MGKVSDLFELKISPHFGKGGTAMAIDWANPASKISKYFKVKEALWLPQWNKLHVPTEDEKKNIIAMAEKMDLVRDFIQFPITINCWMRPTEYNKLIGGAPHSMHIVGSAVDWTAGKDCDNIRRLILPMLPVWKLRLEDKPGSNWLHVDNKDVADMHRFFKP